MPELDLKYDFNGDGKADLLDIVCLLKIVMKDVDGLAIGDINKDGKIDENDLIALIKMRYGGM